jgi:hypothetical protein
MHVSPALSDIPGVWRGGAPLRVDALPTGHAHLDRLLPGGGWPIGAVSELLSDHPGVGEMSLVLPALARLTQSGARVTFVGTPHLPYAPALAQAGVRLPRVTVFDPPHTDDMQWGVEQLLRSGACGAVLAWPSRLSLQELRRLQLAAESGHAICLLMRPLSAAHAASPAALRLRLVRTPAGLDVEVLKARGGASGRHWRVA